jgi:hypothetical protein
VRLPYWPAEALASEEVLADGRLAYLSRYALGRDYHKVMRARLQKLADQISRDGDLATACLPIVRRWPKWRWQRSRAGLAWQAYLAAEPAAGLAVFSG